MGSLAGGMLPFACFLRFVMGKFSPILIFIGENVYYLFFLSQAGFLNGFCSIFLEERKRRNELTLYSCNQAIEVFISISELTYSLYVECLQ